MTDSEQDAPKSAASPGLSAYAQDLITLWQSEMAALTTDREVQEGFQRSLANWSQMAQSMAQSMTQNFAKTRQEASPYDTPRQSGPVASSRPASGAAAPDARDAELARLAERVAELERKLAELQRQS